MNRSRAVSTQTTGCDCDNCRGGDLPATPFLAPRIVHGMLLGEDDFRTLIGYPRGKHLLHQAWLHGSGVIWGYEVCARGLYDLEVGRGLAIDQLGRELLHTRCESIDLNDSVDDWVTDGKIPPAGGKQATVSVQASVLATFNGCLSDPVPTTADPCDITRTHDDYSRVIERTEIEVRYGRSPQRLADRYPRARMLLGVAPLGKGEDADDVRAALQAVREAPDRALELERQLWIMACRDGIHRRPAAEAAEADSWLPAPSEDAGVLLAQLSFTLESRDDCWSFADQPKLEVDPGVRTTLLPTDVLTALTAGLAPGLLGTAAATQQGPRVDAEKMGFAESRRKLIIPVTADLVPGTVAGNVEVTTLTRDGNDHWVVEDLFESSYDQEQQAIVARLAYSLDKRPADALVRVRVIGTGGRPVMGRDPLLPLAGVVGRPPGGSQDGQDAVWTFSNDRGRDTATTAASPSDTGEEQSA